MECSGTRLIAAYKFPKIIPCYIGRLPNTSWYAESEKDATVELVCDRLD